MAAAAMVLVAEGAVFLLRPGDRPTDPAPVSESRFFTAAQIERGRSFSDGQLWLFVATLGAEGVVLVGLALGRPVIVRRRLERLGARPTLGAAAVGAGLSVTLAVATLPAAVAAQERAVDYGISTQGLESWLGDFARSAVISALLAAAGAALLLALLRRFKGLWWIPGTVAVAAIAVVFVWLAPVVLAPLYNRFTPLPATSPARAEVLSLARRAGVDVGQVYRVDASRRVRSLNAYVDGIGSTRRVVLYDNLLRRANRPELRSVVAHELGHVKHDDVPRGLAYLIIVTPLGLLFAGLLGGALAFRLEVDPRSPAALPGYLLGLAVAALVLGVPGNQLSRQVEASADTFALQLTHDPNALIQVQRRLALSSVADPDPPALVTSLIGTHPSTIDRIGAAVAYRRQQAAATR
jgi:Zn-dependent protease with chaperone function